MKNSLEVELKKKLVTVKSPYDIGSILYDYSKKINMKEYIKILEDIIKTFDILKNNVGVYLSSCKEVYDNDEDDIIDSKEDLFNPIIGRGNIKVTMEDNKLKITMECE